MRLDPDVAELLDQLALTQHRSRTAAGNVVLRNALREMGYTAATDTIQLDAEPEVNHA